MSPGLDHQEVCLVFLIIDITSHPNMYEVISPCDFDLYFDDD